MTNTIKFKTLEGKVWRQPIPPYSETNALQAVAVAKSYYDNRNTSNPRFIYNQTTFMSEDSGGYVNDSNGKGKIDCSTFINLVLRGISYTDANCPYQLTATDAIYDLDNMIPNANYPWAFDYFSCYEDVENFHYFTQKTLRTAAEIAEYFYVSGRIVATGCNYQEIIHPGDIIFFRTDIANGRFESIGHVGIITEDTTKYYNANNTSSGYVIYKSDISNPSSLKNREIAFIARPFYEQTMDALSV